MNSAAGELRAGSSSPPSAEEKPGAQYEHVQFLNGLLLVAILISAAALRFYALDASSLWNDEGTTWALLQRSFTQIAHAAAADIHPPGYYFVLKTWTALAGDSAWAMRSFSALIGVALVFVVYQIGVALESQHRHLHTTALLAAWVAALNPFQVYYGQEARMYILLALASAGLYWALFVWVRRESENAPTVAPIVGFVTCGALGLWTHYSFPVVLAAAGMAYVIQLLRTPAGLSPTKTRRLLRYVIVNIVVVLFYLPWLPTGIDRVLNWPKGGEWVSLADGLVLTLQTLLTGPIRSAPELGWPFLIVAAVLPLLGLWSLRSGFAAPALGLWWLAPIAMMAALGLFSDAFLKFVLVSSPAWALLVAAAPLCLGRWERTGQAVLAIAAIVMAASVLPAYYGDPVARDNYAGVARYVQAAGNTASDTVVIDAPGQIDVWSYYDPGLPVLPLPEQRPADTSQTVDRLSSALAGRRHAYALLWATDESDPDRIVETWLDQSAFKGMESWQGNMRFVVYSFASDLACRDIDPVLSFGEDVKLVAECQPAYPQEVMAGDAATRALHRQTSRELDVDYKVSVQLLDGRDQVIAQHDGLTGGGSRPTSTWSAGETVVDNHGMPIPSGTPPGAYRLIAAVYDPTTGERLRAGDGDAVDLGEIEVVRPSEPLPVEVIPIQYHTSKRLGPVDLAGYALHAKGMSHAPETPLYPGDTAHISLLWQAPDPLPAQWPDDLTFTMRLGGEEIAAPLAGGVYPTGQWDAGEIVRGEFDIVYTGEDAAPVITVGADSINLSRLPID